MGLNFFVCLLHFILLYCSIIPLFTYKYTHEKPLKMLLQKGSKRSNIYSAFLRFEHFVFHFP